MKKDDRVAGGCFALGIVYIVFLVWAIAKVFHKV